MTRRPRHRSPGVPAGGGVLFDAGLQPERTALAWRRTALALTVGPAVAARLLAPALGSLALLVAVTGCLLGLAVLLMSTMRYRAIRMRLISGPVPVGLPGGRSLLLAAAVPFLGGSVTVTAVLIAGPG